ncbi:hypothetical protein AYI70_g1928 [Smittium culicis]|uniref:Uncharacterized protein n=1 Tax=Smittium culicis TaxID=133412 RepID=A0A1R1YAL9_9FUNG|nr:hypothetical protein AYI70_g1928 [Smittium culicis]
MSFKETLLTLHAIRNQFFFFNIDDFPLFGSSITVVSCSNISWETDSLWRSGYHISVFDNWVTKVIVRRSLKTFCTTWDIKFHGGQQYWLFQCDQLKIRAFCPIDLLSGNQL